MKKKKSTFVKFFLRSFKDYFEVQNLFIDIKQQLEHSRFYLDSTSLG